MIMLTVPVIPHHHHEDGMICMKNDLPSDGVATIKTLATNIAACDTGCMTTISSNRPPIPNNSDIQPCFVWVTTLFVEPLLKTPDPCPTKQA